MSVPRHAAALCAAALLMAWPARVRTHSGPPFPIVSDHAGGAYSISVWTDPDATDDGTAGGQFWVMLEMADGGEIPPGTRASVTIVPQARPGAPHSGEATPVDGDVSRQFIALLMDHEGPFEVKTTVSGPRGSAAVDATVDATYDLRPPPAMLVLYLLPFAVVAGLWIKLLLRRRARFP
jgi:hypothetical protein